MTGVEGNGSIHDGNGTIGHGLTMDFAKGSSIREPTRVAHLDTKASKHEEKRSLTDRRLSTPVKRKMSWSYLSI